LSQTIQETIAQLHSCLRDYIEATYHISSPTLIEQRRMLLERSGIISQIPYVESTPRYQPGERLTDMARLPNAALQAYLAVSTSQGELPRLVYDPPYKHQSDAIRHSLIDDKTFS